MEVGAHGACMQDLGLWIRIFSVISAILCEILSIANRREVNHGGVGRNAHGFIICVPHSTFSPSLPCDIAQDNFPYVHA